MRRREPPFRLNRNGGSISFILTRFLHANRHPLRWKTLWLLGAYQATAAGAPDIDADEQEQPHHVDEVPVPGGEFEAEVLGRGEMAGVGAQQAHDQEDGADQHMETMEPGRHEEGGAVDIAG